MTEVQVTSNLNESKVVGQENDNLEQVEAKASQHIVVIEVDELNEDYRVEDVAEMNIHVSCPEGCDLRGGTILIGDSSDQVITEQILTYFDDELRLNYTGVFSVQIPTQTGSHNWTIIFFPREQASDDVCEKDVVLYGAGDGVDTSVDTSVKSGDIGKAGQAALEDSETGLHTIAQIEFHFEVLPHKTSMIVWRDDSMPMPVGNEYQIRVGVRCFKGCSLLGQRVSLYQDDSFVANFGLLEPIAPHLDFYQNEVTLSAPSKVGAYTLFFMFEPYGLEISHYPSSFLYTLTTTKQPQCRLELSAINAETGAPVDNAEFTVEPKNGYKGMVQGDTNGKASVDVAWGEYRIKVVREDYQDFLCDITIPEDTDVFEHISELICQPAPEFSENDLTELSSLETEPS